MQIVCRKDFDWDDKLPEEILKRWEEWAKSLSSLSSLSVPRCMIHDDVVHRLQLHTFSDASERGLGAVVYLGIIGPDRVNVSFVMAKLRVTPLKYVSMPWLELCAALMAVRLTNIVKAELKIEVARCVFWTDSTTGLRWINAKTCRF